LHLADRAMLVDRAFRLTRDAAATQYADEDLPQLMAQAGNAANDRSLRGVSLG
jgi:flagellar biosynthesis protein FlhF